MNHQSTVPAEPSRLAGNAIHAGEILARQAPAGHGGAERALPAQARKGEAAESRQDVAIDDIRFCALQSEQDIGAIKYLREELQLPGSAVADPEFQALEKKETSTGWWVPSRAVTH